MESDGIAAFGEVRPTTGSHRLAEGAKKAVTALHSVTALQALAADSAASGHSDSREPRLTDKRQDLRPAGGPIVRLRWSTASQGNPASR
jgi:hypothetical protein